eukprot:TRINITY_DN20764_c0_g1_i2.p1 TRINITY_DN20764_c0_g1~~TRINITY_DN20764_c0_g1_i2.p1  ORF type:complete len:716 (+),score=134.94 TRINITY_DN20764_c0_g1_i2:116-2263(+)
MDSIEVEGLCDELQRGSVDMLGKAISKHLADCVQVEVRKTLQACFFEMFPAAGAAAAVPVRFPYNGLDSSAADDIHRWPRECTALTSLSDFHRPVDTADAAAGKASEPPIPAESPQDFVAASSMWDVEKSIMRASFTQRGTHRSGSFASMDSAFDTRSQVSDRMRRCFMGSSIKSVFDSETASVSTGAVPELRGDHIGRSSPIATIVQHPVFDIVCGALIVMNGIFVGLESDYFAAQGSVSANRLVVYRSVSQAFCVLFLVELCLRVAHRRRAYFTSEPFWYWNIFDAFLLVGQIADEGLTVVTGTSPNLNFTIFRIVRFMACVRPLRVMRLMSLVQGLRDSFIGIGQSFASIMWTVVMMFILIYVLSVHLTEAFAPYSLEDGKVREHFGSVTTSMATLYQAVTGGIDWRIVWQNMPAPAAQYAAVIMHVYVGIVVFTLLNNITSSFVESALRMAKRQKDITTFNLAKELFLSTDSDRDGVLSWEEFATQLDSKSMQEYFSVLDLDISEAKTVFSLIDADDSGQIDVNEFVNGCFRLRGSAKAVEFAVFLRDFYDMSDMVRETLERIPGLLKEHQEMVQVQHQDQQQQKQLSCRPQKLQAMQEKLRQPLDQQQQQQQQPQQQQQQPEEQQEQSQQQKQQHRQKQKQEQRQEQQLEQNGHKHKQEQKSGKASKRDTLRQIDGGPEEPRNIPRPVFLQELDAEPTVLGQKEGPGEDA